VLTKAYGLTEDEKLHNELHNLYFSLNTVWVIKTIWSIHTFQIRF